MKQSELSTQVNSSNDTKTSSAKQPKYEFEYSVPQEDKS